MSRLSKRTLLDLTCALLESQSLSQLQARTEPLLRGLFHADHVAFCRMHPELPSGFEWWASTIGHFLRNYYQWYQDDFVFRWLSRHPNKAWSDTEMLRGQKLGETETYRRSRESHLGLRHVLAVLLAPKHQAGMGGLVLYSDRVRAFSNDKRRWLQEFTPALTRAFQNSARFGALSSHNQLLEELLRQEGAHAIVLDGSRREVFRTEAVTSLLERWFPSRSERDSGGLPCIWRERIDASLSASLLGLPPSLTWREAREFDSLEVSFTRLPRLEQRDLWELRLREVPVLPESWRGILTPKRFMVVELVAKGLSNKEIADQLEMSESQVKDFVRESRKKLKVTSGRTGLIDLARRS